MGLCAVMSVICQYYSAGSRFAGSLYFGCGPANRHSSKDERLSSGLDREASGTAKTAALPGPMAEWLRRGLQILARRFDSGSGLHPLSLSGPEQQCSRMDRLPATSPKKLSALIARIGELAANAMPTGACLTVGARANARS
jgi:hypothetical protein